MRARVWATGVTGGALVLAVLVPAGPAQAGPDPVTTITLLNVNDFHGRIDPTNNLTTRWATTIERERQAAGQDNTLLLAAGDLIGASLFNSAVARDQPTIDVMNELCLAASSVGNHEFDQGFADLTGRVINGAAGVAPTGCPSFGGTQSPGTNALWSYLGANIYTKGTQTPALPEYATFEVPDGSGGSVTVGVVGAVTAETPVLVSPGGITQIDVGDPVAAVNRVADQLTDSQAANGEADVLVVEYHEGAPDGSATPAQNAAASPAFNAILTQTSPKFSAIFTGHTHQSYSWQQAADGRTGGFRPLLQTGNYADHVGKVVLTYDPSATPKITVTHAVNLLPAASPDLTLPRVRAVDDLVTQAKAYADLVGKQPIATQAAAITTAYTGGSYSGPGNTYQMPGGPTSKLGRDDRASESTMGALVANALRDSLAPAHVGGAELGVVNPGGLRDELFYPQSGSEGDGVTTYAEANNVLPFLNNLWTTTLTGAQLKTMLEQQWQRDASGNVPSRPYLQLGLSDNVTYTYDDSLPEGARITSITINGAPYEPARGYRVGTFAFLVAGGDNFRVFTQGANARDSGLVDRDAWVSYLDQHSPVAPDFARQSVRVSGMPSTVEPGQALTFALGQLDLTSFGSPANTSVAVSVGDAPAGSVPVSNGSARVSLSVPPTAPTGTQLVAATASPSGTKVTFPVTVLAPAEQPPAGQPPAAQPPAGQPPVTQPPDAQTPAARLKVRVRVSAARGRSELHVNVGPNRTSGSWRFQVQRRQANGTWKKYGSYRTHGPKELRTLALPKGTYRVVIKGQHGFAGRTSGRVTLAR